MEEFVRAIPAAAASPYALAAYAIAAIIFLFAGARLRLAKTLLAKIETIPPDERRRTVEIATGTVLPTSISPEQWIRNNRLRWAFLLAASILIVILVIAIIALVNPGAREIEKLGQSIEEGNQQVKIDLWRNRYGMGEISGSAWIAIDLTGTHSTLGLNTWLGRVEKQYKAMKASNIAFPTTFRGSDQKGDEYLEINTLASQNLDMLPNSNEDEKFVDELLFNSHFILLATGGTKRGLLLSPLSFSAKATSVKTYFDPATNKPNKIEGFASGTGTFRPVPGQFTNWLDFYGSTLIARQIFSINPIPASFDLVEYESITFEAKDDQWVKSATFAMYTDQELFTDSKRSLIVKNADWKTLGQVPKDYPGKRLLLYGPEPEAW